MPTRHPPGPQRPHGFTLIEVMVALFIFAVMSGMAWQGIASVMRTRDVAQARTDRLMRLQTVMAQWEADLKGLADSGVVPGLDFEGPLVRLTRRQADGVQVVVWTLRSDGLHRWTAPAVTTSAALQEAWLRSLQLVGNDPADVLVMPGVQGWQLYTMHGSDTTWSNAQSSGDVMASATPASGSAGSGSSGGSGTRREALPKGVRLVVEPAGVGTITRDLRLVHP